MSSAAGNSRRGASALGCLLQLAIVGAVIYFASFTGRDLLDYYRFRDAMKQEARFAGVRGDQQIRDRLRAFADSVGLPPAAQEVNIVREADQIRIWSEYEEQLKLPLDYQRSIRLRPSVEQRL